MSYAELIANLTADDRKALAAQGVPASRVSEWKTGFRLPTRPQTLALALVKNIDPIALERELMLIETEKEAERKPEARELLNRARERYNTLMM